MFFLRLLREDRLEPLLREDRELLLERDEFLDEPELRDDRDEPDDRLDEFERVDGNDERLLLRDDPEIADRLDRDEVPDREDVPDRDVLDRDDVLERVEGKLVRDDLELPLCRFRDVKPDVRDVVDDRMAGELVRERLVTLGRLFERFDRVVAELEVRELLFVVVVFGCDTRARDCADCCVRLDSVRPFTAVDFCVLDTFDLPDDDAGLLTDLDRAACSRRRVMAFSDRDFEVDLLVVLDVEFELGL